MYEPLKTIIWNDYTKNSGCSCYLSMCKGTAHSDL